MHMKNFLEKIKFIFKQKKKIFVLVGVIILLFGISFLSNLTSHFFFPTFEETDSEYFDCNVMGIEIRGELYTYVPTDKDGNKIEGYEDTTTSEDVVSLIWQAENDDNIKGTLIEVDSFGGSPVAGEEIANEIKLAKKPVVAFIREIGTSASYLAISPSDRIFGSKYSDIGSIGVTMSYLDNISKNQQEGYSFVQLSTGKFKDSGSPDKVLTQEERNLFMRDLKIAHENFIQSVSENRNIAIEKVREIADGSTVMGEKAVELGLIDEIGSYNEAEKYIEEQTGEDINVCW